MLIRRFFSALIAVVLVAIPMSKVFAAQVSNDGCDVTVSNATGVVVTVARNGDCVVSFKNVGTTIWARPANVTNARVFVVAGGGGGGGHPSGDPGGGGGGGIVDVPAMVLNQASYEITVGQGGRGNDYINGGPPWYAGQNGSESKFAELVTAIGGGGGGGAYIVNRSGGSGGGGHSGGHGGAVIPAIIDASVDGAISYGGAGGKSIDNGSGGGGGATEPGEDGSSIKAGTGGEGLAADVVGSGTSVVYGSGGGGAGATAFILVSSGGTNAGSGVIGNGIGSSGVANTGAGGGGQLCTEERNPLCAGSGGSGVVIIRYSDSSRPTTTTTTTSTTIASTTIAPVTTVRSSTSTAAPTLDIVVNASTATSVQSVGQAQIPKLATSTTSVISKSSLPNRAATSRSTTTSTSIVTVPKTNTAVAPIPPTGGVAAIKVGNSTEQVVVERASSQLIVTAGKLKAVVGGLNADGSQKSLDSDGNVSLKPGDQVRIRLAGFKPGSTMDVWLFSTPIRLGNAKVGADGTVIGLFTVPRKTPPGSHRVVIATRTIDGKPVTLAVGINVGSYKNSLKVPTWLLVTPLVMAVGFAMFLPPAVRQRRKRDKIGA